MENNSKLADRTRSLNVSAIREVLKLATLHDEQTLEQAIETVAGIIDSVGIDD